MKLTFTLLSASLVLLATSSSANAVLIDSFNSPLGTPSGGGQVVNGPSGTGTATGLSGVFGNGSRTVTVTLQNGNTGTPSSVNVNTFSSGLMQYQESSSRDSEFSITWLSTGGTSLVSSGENYLVLTGVQATGGLSAPPEDITVTVFTGSSSSTYSTTIPVNGAPTTLTLPLATPTSTTGGGATLSNITKIVMTGDTITSANPNKTTWGSSITVDQIQTAVPEPSSLALLAIGAGGLATVYRRRKKIAS